MGEAKRKMMAQGASSASVKASGSDRGRVNISVPAGVLRALEGMASVSGMTVSQVALSAVLAGLPEVGRQHHIVHDFKTLSHPVR